MRKDLVIGILIITMVLFIGNCRIGVETREARIEKLIAQLDDNKDWEKPILAADELVKLDAKEALPALIKFLKDGKRVPCCCGSAIDNAIIKLGGKTVIPEMRQLLKSKDYVIRSTAIEILGGVDAKESIPDLLKLLQTDNSSGIRATIIDNLAKLGTKEEMIPLFIELFGNDSSSDVPWACSYAIIKLGGKEEILQVAKFLDSEDEIRRELSIYVIFDIINKKILSREEVAELQESRNKYIRGLAAISLIELDVKDRLSKNSIEDIKAVLEYPKWDCNKNIKHKAQQVLKSFGIEEKKQ